MVTMTQSAANGRNTHTHVDRTHSRTHLHKHSYNHIVRSANSANTEFGIKLYFEGSWGNQLDSHRKSEETVYDPTCDT